MAEPAAQRVAERDANPLARDSELFYGYMGLLDEVLDQGEIRAALADQNLSSNQVRMRCSAASAGVLREATSEYAAYEAALGEYERTLVQVKRRENRDAGDWVLRTAALGLGVAGAVAILVGLLVGQWWSTARMLWQPGAGMLVVAGAAFAVAIARFTELGIRLLGGEAAGAVAGELDRIRQRRPRRRRPPTAPRAGCPYAPRTPEARSRIKRQADRPARRSARTGRPVHGTLRPASKYSRLTLSERRVALPAGGDVAGAAPPYGIGGVGGMAAVQRFAAAARPPAGSIGTGRCRPGAAGVRLAGAGRPARR